MRPIARKLHDYRWELWLFIGAVYAPWISIIGIAWGGYLYDMSHTQINSLYEVAALAFLIVPYWWVRRFSRPLLVALWQYMLLETALLLFHVLLYQSLLGQDNPSLLDEPWHTPVQWLSVTSLYSFQIMLLLAFGRRLSRVDMNKVVAFVLIVSLLHLDFVVWRWYAISHYSFPEESLILWVRPMLLGLVLAYITSRADTGRPVRTLLQLALMALVYGGYLWFVVWAELPYLNTHNWHWGALKYVLFAWSGLSPTHVIVWLGTLMAVYVWAKLRPPPPITPFPPDEPDTLITGPQHPVPVKQ